jgi:formate dehydrogenase major subunit
MKGRDQDPGWQQITWSEAYSIIASKIKDALSDLPYKHGTDYYYNGKDNPISWLGSSYWNNEECYLGRKLISLLGSNNVEHQARKCHASTVAALGSTFGFGAMTNHIIDAKNSKCFLIMSNPAESHSMEFKWVTEAIDNGAKVIVLDPRFTRSAAKADIYARYRSGSEAAIFLGLIRYVLYEKPERIDETFLETRTNASVKVDGTSVTDWLTNPASVFSKLKALVDPYTPAEVERLSGIPQAQFIEIADTFSSLKPGNIYYSMGTTQHSNATQAIRAHAILQLVLGNKGRGD